MCPLKTMGCVFGPIGSRRLGRSLGIDPIPFKTCNWNCVYCQLGRTRPFTLERGEYISRQAILDEVERKLAEIPAGQFDWVTFVGSGEPTLNSQLGWLIRGVKDLSQNPVAVITNGSLMIDAQVRDELGAADAVLPTLDAGTERLYRRINRPAPKYTFERFIEGMESFRAGYRGQLWVEVMLVKGMNDNAEALLAIKDQLDKIQPDQVHLTLPIRPPAESWVQLVDENSLETAIEIFGATAKVLKPAAIPTSTGMPDSLEEAILGIITRHPLTSNDLVQNLDQWEEATILSKLEDLLEEQKIQLTTRYGRNYWSSVKARYRA